MNMTKERLVACGAIGLGAGMLGFAVAGMGDEPGALASADGTTNPALVILLMTVAVIGFVFSLRNRKK